MFILLSREGNVATGAQPRAMKRKLTTIFCADVAGYSRMMGANEARTLGTLKEYREAIEGFIARHHGRVVSWSGDGLLSEFQSVVEAVQCAAEVQQELSGRNTNRPDDERMAFRIGINLGDVMEDGTDIFGEGVNIAARLQQMAPAGGILVASSVYDQVKGKLTVGFSSLGTQSVKNIAGEVGIYAVNVDGVTPPSRQGQSARSMARAVPAYASGAPARPGRLFRRGLALAVDYVAMALAGIGLGLVINAMISPTTIRMDLDLPFVNFDGDTVAATEWLPVDIQTGENSTVVREERTVTYDYFGLFLQTYRQHRTSGRVSEARGNESVPDPVPPAPDEAVAVPGPPETGKNDVPAWIDKIPGVSVEPDGSVSIGGGIVVLDQDGVHWDLKRKSPAAGEGTGTSLAWDRRKNERWGVSFSSVKQTLVDATTGKPITRLSMDMLILLLLVGYFTVMEARHSATLGKRAFQLSVAADNGQPTSFGTSFGRAIIKSLTTWFYFVIPISLLLALVSRRRQSLHDMIAGTVVIRGEP